MIDFDYVRANDVSDAIRKIAADSTARFIAGGTNLIDLMKEDVALPRRLIDITGLPLAKIEETATGGLRIGALVPNSALPMTSGSQRAIRCSRAQSLPAHRRSFATWPRPEAISCSGRVACISTTPRRACNKREPGSGCAARDGFNRMNAILG